MLFFIADKHDDIFLSYINNYEDNLPHKFACWQMFYIHLLL